MHPFQDWTVEQLLSLLAGIVGVIMMAMAMHRDSQSDRDRYDAKVAEQQLVSDKLDSIADMSKETRDTVREMSKQLNDHSRELAKIETRIEEHDRRLDKMDERLCGTD